MSTISLVFQKILKTIFWLVLLTSCSFGKSTVTPNTPPSELEVVSINQKQTPLISSFTIVKTYDHCNSAGTEHPYIKYSDFVSKSSQEELKFGGEVGLSNLAMLKIGSEIKSYNNTLVSGSHEEGTVIDVPAYTKVEVTLFVSEKRYTGSVEYKEFGILKETAYSYRTQFTLDNTKQVDIPCSGQTQSTTSTSHSQVFNDPSVNGYRLDYCYGWAGGCGLKAAVEWCKTQGFSGVIDFQQAADVGLRGIRTQVLATGQICDAENCDSFTSITCGGADPLSKPQQQVFSDPTVNGYRLDICYKWGDACGVKAAAEWCKLQGFTSIIDFQEATDIGSQGVRTVVLGTGDICDAVNCDSFSSITCVK